MGSKLDAKVGGTARLLLQSSLFTQYLDYHPFVRQGVDDGQFIMSVQRDAAEVVDKGYVGMIRVMMHVEKLAFAILFKFVSPYVFGGRVRIAAIVPLLMLPFILGVFLCLRQKAILSCLHTAFDTEVANMDQLHMVADNADVILDYDKANYAEQLFIESVKMQNSAKKIAAQILLNTDYFAKWVTTLLTGGYTVFGGLQVLRGHISVGAFIVTLEIFATCGAAFCSIFSDVVDIQSTYPSMMSVWRLLNLSTKCPALLQIARSHATHPQKVRIFSKTSTKPSGLQADSGVAANSHDQMMIEIDLYENFEFETELIAGPRISLNFKGTMEIDQGMMVAIVGGLGAGKGTLLQLIAGRRLPHLSKIGKDSRGVFVPSHLRITSVSANPVFYVGTLLQNICLGVKNPTSSERERVVNICNKLQAPGQVLEYLDHQDDWQTIFSESTCKLISIVRALHANAEITCFHKPLDRLEESQWTDVLKALRDHMSAKGLFLEGDPQFRRPRTIFVTTNKVDAMLGADLIYQITTDTGISKLNSKEVTDTMIAIEETKIKEIESKRACRFIEQARESKQELRAAQW